MSSSESLEIRCDGGSRGNPGPGASAFIVYRDNNELYSKSYFFEKTTNNIAEYFAVLMATAWISKEYEELGSPKVTFYLDSELVVKQLNGIYKIKNLALLNIATKIKKIITDKTIKVGFQHVRRELNKAADALVNKELDEKLG